MKKLELTQMESLQGGQKIENYNQEKKVGCGQALFFGMSLGSMFGGIGAIVGGIGVAVSKNCLGWL